MVNLTVVEAKNTASTFLSLGKEHSVRTAIENNRSLYKSTLNALRPYKEEDSPAGKFYRALVRFR